ncbi:L-galactonate dehydratase [Vanrija pseudolonga]|uniref:L-galactonate dehydratase n=1 Tax=Vanrija pseudolonga TaxID=143232 RepID=A0AAF1BJ65_9TREE|nr:L-galactonate dehydratase [Vanrija pseudolonga]
MSKIIGYTVEDLRYPTSLTGDGTDAMNQTCDYSCAYVTLFTDGTEVGYGMTFTIGRGNDIVVYAAEQVAERLVGKSTTELFGDMGAMWTYLLSDPQHRWIGPEKGVIHLATAAVVNAVWDMYARSQNKPLWRLIADMSPEEIVRSTCFRYITDALTPEEALEILKEKEAGRKERIAHVEKEGYPAYVTSVGWYGYSDELVEERTRHWLKAGFNHFKLKVGVNVDDDRRRMALIRKIIDDPKNSEGVPRPDPKTIAGKNAGPTDCVLMIDANQVWDMQEAVDYVKQLAEYKPWFIEEPTAPDDVLAHAEIRRQLKPYGVGVATGEHAHNRMVFKQLLQANAIDVCQIDSCRLAGVNEILGVLLMSAKYGVPVCPHAGGIGLCQYTIHLSLIDYVAISGSIDTNVLEYAQHLHENFVNPVSLNAKGRYNVPSVADEGYSIQITDESRAKYVYPHGSYWSSPEAVAAHKLEEFAPKGNLKGKLARKAVNGVNGNGVNRHSNGHANGVAVNGH